MNTDAGAGTRAKARAASLDQAIQITGLAEALYEATQLASDEHEGDGPMLGAQNLAWAYRCMARAAEELAKRLQEAA